ncbi:hypothetical protein ACE3MQ_12785 [Paenibacillus lentus]|uniref:hypothetical protein n=1 Tax=Paenibacillus lentus TaxID=1338368 RepID=UPI0036562C27
MKWIWLGIVLQYAGLIWDEIYHQTRVIVVEYIPIPHWPIVAAPFVIVIMTYKYLRSEQPQVKVLTILLLVASLIMLTGTVWDNFGYHIRGIELPEDAPPHVTLQLGSYLTLLLLIASTITNTIKKRRVKRDVSA